MSNFGGVFLEQQPQMTSMNQGPSKKPSFVLKEFQAQKDKSTNDAVVTLRPEMYANAKADDKEAKLKKDTIGIYRVIANNQLTNRASPI